MMTQLNGMIRYEILMHWRRRGILMMMILLLVMLVGITLIISNNGVMRNQIQRALQPLDDEARVNTILSINLLLLTMMGFSITVPLMTAETVPVDHQYQVSDLLNSLPLTRTTYLLGKLLGIWSILGMGLGICFLISALLTWALIGKYDVMSYLLLWLIAVVPITLFTSALGTLLGSTQPSRRAIILLAPLSIYPYAIVVFTMNSIWQVMKMLRPDTVANVFVFAANTDESDPATMYLFLAANIIFYWLAAWTWRRWREGR
jgi:ABC-type transport system involved in multi-copper enzyme maturation permease subunit